jgi:23S rRNA (uridine2552-2'-O)-methyltransferase
MIKRNKRGGALSNQQRINDKFYLQAKSEGFLARSVFKLEEIDKKFRLFPATNRKEPFFVIDLGCSPGSWLQYICPKLPEHSKVLGIDIVPVHYGHHNLVFIQEDINAIKNEDLLQHLPKVNLILSDMAPKTSGVREQDQEGSLELCRQALRIAVDNLSTGGAMVTKVFYILDPDVKAFVDETKKYFTEVQRFKPESSRSESYEFFLVCRNFKKL